MGSMPDPVTLIVLLGSLSLLPFIIILGTSFVKLVIVFSLVRNALGVQQIPPNMALHGLALILTLYIMAPVGLQTFENVTSEEVNIQDRTSLQQAFTRGIGPYREFLKEHSNPAEVAFFQKTASKLWDEKFHTEIQAEHMLILIPAFVIGELTLAFEIGFLLYLPFIVIDLIISNILLAMGMMMLSPMTISLPFKLLLFVFLDGWSRLIHGLILSYG
ncbi:MAG: type III secretion system export apparatus subunit SctR [Candidatus Oxydemutatoraceae bacterium WSBS_2016_MAG_OTU14]